MGKTLALVLDDGHGMETSGKYSYITGMKENEFNKAVVKELVRLCKLNNVLYLEVAPTDSDTPLNDRINAANRWYRTLKSQYGNDLVCVYLSCHANAGGGTGVETWVHSKASVDTTNLGAEISAEIARVGKIKNRGVKKGFIGQPDANFAVNAGTQMTSVLIEHAFMDTGDDAYLLVSDWFRTQCALADMTAVMKHFGFGVPVTSQPATPPVQKKPEYKIKIFDFGDKEKATEISKVITAAGYYNEVRPNKDKWCIEIFNFKSKDKVDALAFLIKNQLYCQVETI